MKIGLSAFGTPYAMGLRSESGRRRIGAFEFMQRAIDAELDGVEMPFALLEGEDEQEIAAFAKEHRLFLVVATGGTDSHSLRPAIETAAKIGAKTVRTVVGGAYIGGDRRHLAGQWRSFLEEVLEGLREAAKIARSEGVVLGVENHQDLASEELLYLCEQIASPSFGLILDTGNPLATAEEPLDFARRVLPHLVHVHLKDYWIYLTEVGYRLVRCPIGQGVIDFPALFSLFNETTKNMTMSIEVGALEARHIRAWADDYWTEYPQRSAVHFANTVRFVMNHARVAGDWQTPLEKSEPMEQIIAYEENQLSISIAYMKGLLAFHAR